MACNDVEYLNVWQRLKVKIGERTPHFLKSNSIEILITIVVVFVVPNVIGVIGDGAVAVGSFIEDAPRVSKVILTAVVSLLFAGLYRLYRHYRHGTAAISAGLFSSSPNSHDDDIDDVYIFIHIESIKCRELRVCGATGWDTFGKCRSPLHRAIKACSVVNILLIDPTSSDLINRARDVRLGLDEYRAEIYKSVNFLQHVYDEHNANISLKFYNNYPFWKYIFLDEFVWVWQYPTDRHVKESPCYGFKKLQKKSDSTDGQVGMYDHMLAQFNKRWASNRFWSYNFETGKAEKIVDGKTSAKDIWIDAPSCVKKGIMCVEV